MSKNKSKVSSYNEEDIDVVDLDVEKIKHAHGMYIGYSNTKAFLHLIKEVLQNSIDENCEHVSIDYDPKTKTVTIGDNGRGIPSGKVVACATIIQASGKFKKGKKGVYKFAAGTHGVGLTCANALSCEMTIITWRENKLTKIMFVKGHVVGEEVTEIKPGDMPTPSGTLVTFDPNEDIIGKVDVKESDILELANTMSYNTGSRIVVTIKKKKGDETHIVHHPNGIRDLISQLAPNHIIPYMYFEEMHEYNDGEDAMYLETSWTYVSDLSTLNMDTAGLQDNFVIISYANFCTTIEGGSHVNGFLRGITDAVGKYVRDEIVTKRDKDLQILPADIKDGLVAIVNVKLTKCKFIGQVKEKLDADHCVQFIKNTMVRKLNKWFKDSEKDSKTLGNYIKEVARVRTRAQKDRKASIKTDVRNAFNGLSPKKYARASGKKDLELWLNEGDSAHGAVAQARGHRQSYMESYALRGVSLNVFDLTPDKVRANAELNNIIGLLGCGFGKSYNPDLCRYKRIVLAMDADIDGGKISSILIVFFTKYYPELIERGIICKAIPPLYMVEKGSKKLYLADGKAYAEFIRKEIGDNIDVYHATEDGKKGTKVKPKELVEILEKSENYMITLNKQARRFVCNKTIMEICANNVEEIFRNNMTGLKAELKKMYPYLKVIKDKDKVVITGLAGRDSHYVKIGNRLRKAIDKIDLAGEGVAIKYYVEGRGCLYRNQLYDLVSEYEPKHRQRFKGLGEMSADELEEHVLDPNNRTIIKFRLDKEGLEADIERLRVLHSEKCREERRKIVQEFKINVNEIDT